MDFSPESRLWLKFQGDFEGALTLYDNEVRNRMKTTEGMFELSDAVGMLYRLEMQGEMGIMFSVWLLKTA